jgi:hypothetical protein
VLKTRYEISRWSKAEADAIAADVAALETAEEVSAYLAERVKR